ncbi:hypothetical protein ZIOFF_043934 [Zingiber officinale]|uniref:Uncharacterized protein n=1 Tax=Zingiber officinale TaxID=94328 RepID=A0A8J5FXI4_ZINOF|nr:hypothetical protein ZIOFF_043934 [Zingiber officinale]
MSSHSRPNPTLMTSSSSPTGVASFPLLPHDTTCRPREIGHFCSLFSLFPSLPIPLHLPRVFLATFSHSLSESALGVALSHCIASPPHGAALTPLQLSTGTSKEYLCSVQFGEEDHYRSSVSFVELKRRTQTPHSYGSVLGLVADGGMGSSRHRQ